MAKQITPKIIEIDTATSLACCVDKYDLEAANIQIIYSLRNQNDEQIKQGVITFGEEVVNSWGSNNDVIWNAVATELNITFI